MMLRRRCPVVSSGTTKIVTMMMMWLKLHRAQSADSDALHVLQLRLPHLLVDGFFLHPVLRIFCHATSRGLSVASVRKPSTLSVSVSSSPVPQKFLVVSPRLPCGLEFNSHIHTRGIPMGVPVPTAALYLGGSQEVRNFVTEDARALCMYPKHVSKPRSENCFDILDVVDVFFSVVRDPDRESMFVLHTVRRHGTALLAHISHDSSAHAQVGRRLHRVRRVGGGNVDRACAATPEVDTDVDRRCRQAESGSRWTEVDAGGDSGSGGRRADRRRRRVRRDGTGTGNGTPPGAGYDVIGDREPTPTTSKTRRGGQFGRRPRDYTHSAR